MDLEFILLADKAEAANGKLSMLGGGWDRITPESLPALVSYDLVVSLKFDPHEDRSHLVDFSLEGPGGERVLGPLGGPITLPEATGKGRIHMVLGGPFPMEKYGTYRWIARVDGSQIGHIEFEVAPPTAPAVDSAPANVQRIAEA
jgi:hypothetical protein